MTKLLNIAKLLMIKTVSELGSWYCSSLNHDLLQKRHWFSIVLLPMWWHRKCRAFFSFVIYKNHPHFAYSRFAYNLSHFAYSRFAYSENLTIPISPTHHCWWRNNCFVFVDVYYYYYYCYYSHTEIQCHYTRHKTM